MSTSAGRKLARSPRHAREEAIRLIQDGAKRFLWDRPFRELTVRALMADTELSRPAFYQYFTDVHDLILSLLAEIEAEMHRLASPWLTGQGEPIEAVRESLRGVIETFAAHGPVLRAIVEAAPTDSRLEQAWDDFLGQWDDAIETRIREQQEAGLVPPFDARRMARTLNRLDAIVMVTAFGKRPQDDIEEVLAVEHRIWVGALYWRP
jgi:AcrR family transcriptional regulator